MRELSRQKAAGLIACAFILCGSAAVSTDAASPLRLPLRQDGGSGLMAGSGIRWHRSFNEGWKVARERRLPMVIFITSGKCRFCDAMKLQTWCDESVSHRVTEEFVAIELNPDDNAEVLGRIDVDVFPMTLVGVPEGRIVAHRKGYQPPEAMAKLLDEAASSLR